MNKVDKAIEWLFIHGPELGISVILILYLIMLTHSFFE
jgi:hypothetical protein